MFETQEIFNDLQYKDDNKEEKVHKSSFEANFNNANFKFFDEI